MRMKAKICDDLDGKFYVPLYEVNDDRNETDYCFCNEPEVVMSFRRWQELGRLIGRSKLDKIYYFNSRRQAIRQLHKHFPDLKNPEKNVYIFEIDKVPI